MRFAVMCLSTNAFYSAALIALLVQVVALPVMLTAIASQYLSIARTQLIVLQGGIAVGLYFLLTLVFNVSNVFFILRLHEPPPPCPQHIFIFFGRSSNTSGIMTALAISLGTLSISSLPFAAVSLTQITFLTSLLQRTQTTK